MGMVRAYLAMSLDGFVAGPDDDLAWLERQADDAPVAAGAWAQQDEGTEDQALGFEPFLDGVGAILMGRRTYDIVEGFDGWHYRDIPMLVATHRTLSPARPSVRPAAGDITELVASARQEAGGKDVYVDGAALVSATLDAGLLEHLVITLMPTVLGGGVALFGGAAHPTEMTVEKVARYGPGLVQLHLTPGTAAA